MANLRRLSIIEIAIGAGVLLVSFVVVHLIAGGLSLQVPQSVLSAVSAAVGIAIWFAIINRRMKS
jgi:hypothetical protein